MATYAYVQVCVDDILLHFSTGKSSVTKMRVQFNKT